MGYTMSLAEVTYWQDLAALLDPDAYEFVGTNSTSQTVPSGEHWYLQEGWCLATSGGGSKWYHRGGDVRDALPLSEGTVIATSTGEGVGTAHMYLCKPALVVSGDDRYTNDPRALYFERIMRLASELEQFQIGGTQTGGGTTDASFPTDFTNGMIVHVSTQDLAWVIPANSAETLGLIMQMEISDIDPVRIAAVALVPFKRTTFPKVLIQGANLSTGRGSVTYVKLPGDW